MGSSAPADADTPLARTPAANTLLTGVQEKTTNEAGVKEAIAEEADSPDAGPTPGEHPAANATVSQFSQAEKRNVVLIHLESTRAQSTTPYNENLKTMPFLAELAKSSLLAERAYVVLPRSSKSTVAINCGIEPALYPGPEFRPSGIPARCLAHLLREQDYRTVFFTSVSNALDNYGDVVKNLGYEEYYPAESMNTEGYQWTNSFGYEEDIMLGPSERWLRAYGNKPFMAEYMTGTGHYGYECVPNRYGYVPFSEEEDLDRYHNCLRMLNHFLENLFDQYKRLGLYENTIFVIFGDHGEGFGEHGRFMHGDTPYEEGIRIPLIIHAPGWFENGERAAGLSNGIDILPTVVEMLGYEVKDGVYPGYSLLHPLPEERTLMFSCITNRKCLASIKGYEKYIYHYGNQPDEFFDLSEDPLEMHNLADEYSNEELDERREDLLAWRTRVNAQHGDILINGTVYSEE
jgi:lipoteichoic acid synthase